MGTRSGELAFFLIPPPWPCTTARVLAAALKIRRLAGKPTRPVVIEGCGELPSRRKILARMQEQKTELANMKKDVVAVGCTATCLDHNRGLGHPGPCLQTPFLVWRMTPSLCQSLLYASRCGLTRSLSSGSS